MTPQERAKAALSAWMDVQDLNKEEATERAVTQAIKDAIEECAKVADAAIDPEWPNDDQSVQCKRIASDIRALSINS